MIEVGTAQLQRDEDGMGFHPAFPWDSVPADTNIIPHITLWGYESKFVQMEDDAPDDIQRRYEDDNSPDCSYWTPTQPEGEGWFLAAVYDNEDGPMAVFFRPLNQTPKP